MTISFAIIAMLTTAQADPMDEARIEYSNCIVRVMNEKLEADASKKSFQDAAKETCSAERQAFTKLVAASEKEYGSDDTEANTYAEEEATNILNGWSTSFDGHKAAKTRAVEE